MTLARVHEIKRYIGMCNEHPYWATPSYNDREAVERLVHEHNEAEHEGIESND